MPPPIRFWGTVLAVRPRLILSKYEGETTPHCPGYILTVQGTRTEGTHPPQEAVVTVAIGPATMEEKQIAVGALVRGDAHPVSKETYDVPADLYRVGVLRVIAPGKPPETPDPPRTDTPHAPTAAEQAPRRALAAASLEPGGVCERCPHGLIVCTVKLTDPRFPKRGQWFHIPACLGPQGCPHYVRE